MRAKTVINNWDDLYMIIPESIKRILLKMQNIRENPEWHPESSAAQHVELVTDKAIKLQDPDLIMAGLFHDLGKAYTAKLNSKTGYMSSHGHEQISAELLDTPEYREFIEDFGADYDVVRWIVSNHMRIHIFKEMSPKKQQLLMDNSNFEKLKIFGKLDDMINR